VGGPENGNFPKFYVKSLKTGDMVKVDVRKNYKEPLKLAEEYAEKSER
jgi:predicted transcriptional regulator